MSDESNQRGDAKPANELEAMFSAQAQEAAEHAASCKAPSCARCGRHKCSVCAASYIAYSAEQALETICNGCRTKLHRKAWTASGLATIPKAFEHTALDRDWLVALVGAAAIARARVSLAAPRVAFVGPAGAGKTSLAVAMFRAAVIGDTPTPAADWAPNTVKRRFGSEHLYVSAFALAKARGNSPIGRESELIERALHAPLVLIDELGGEDPRYASAVTEVIYERHAAELATWITTGVGAKEIAQRYGGGIARKALEDAEVFELGRKP